MDRSQPDGVDTTEVAANHAMAPLRGERLHQAAQDRIKRFMIERRLRPGDPLPAEAEIAHDLGVGRNTVREAVKGLQTLGMIEARQGVGLFVGQFSLASFARGLTFQLALDGSRDLKQVRDLLEIRVALECALIPRAMSRLTMADLARLEQLVQAMEDKAICDEGFPDEDRAFHKGLYLPLGNDLVIELIHIFWDGFSAVRAQLPARPVSYAATAADHRRILERVAAGDGPGAADAIAHDLSRNQIWLAALPPS